MLLVPEFIEVEPLDIVEPVFGVGRAVFMLWLWLWFAAVPELIAELVPIPGLPEPMLEFGAGDEVVAELPSDEPVSGAGVGDALGG